MPDTHTHISDDSPGSESFGTLPQRSEAVGTVPNQSERVGSVPHAAEPFHTPRNTTELNRNHTLTVREVARMFEVAGVARTERSIVKWCLPNKHDVARLDAFFDANERRWFITPESAERAIAEEQAKAARNNDSVPPGSEGVGTEGQASGADKTSSPEDAGLWTEQVKKLEQEVLDLKILNGGKDFLIDQLRTERERLFNQVVDSSRQVGQLEVRLRQLSSVAAGPAADELHGD